MASMNYRDALKLALKEAMAANSRLIVLGQDVSGKSLSRLTTGLAAVHGESRIRDCPISESAMVGFGVGAAMRGYTTLVEVAYADILAVCFSSIVHSAAKLSFATNGRMGCPLVIRAPIGRFSRHGPMGTEVTASWFYNVPDLTIAMPSSANEAYWCMRAALHSQQPTIFYDDRALHGTKGSIKPKFAYAPVPESAEVCVIAAGRLAAMAETAAREMADGRRRRRVHVLSLGTIKPLPEKPILAAAKSCQRVLILQDEPPNGGYGPAVRGLLDKLPAGSLKAPPRLVSAPDSFLPYHWEEDYLLNQGEVAEQIEAMLP
jgi:2-oxoisovalerate dehydrogenase E1 component beta subunit